MQTPNFEIPTEMRDFAEKSVDQARNAVGTMMANAIKASRAGQTSGHTFQSTLSAAVAKGFDHAQANANATFDFAQKPGAHEGPPRGVRAAVRVRPQPVRRAPGPGQGLRRPRPERRPLRLAEAGPVVRIGFAVPVRSADPGGPGLRDPTLERHRSDADTATRAGRRPVPDGPGRTGGDRAMGKPRRPRGDRPACAAEAAPACETDPAGRAARAVRGRHRGAGDGEGCRAGGGSAGRGVAARRTGGAGDAGRRGRVRSPFRTPSRTPPRTRL